MLKKVIILGGSGLLGKNLILTCKERNIEFLSVGRKNCDLNLDLSNYSSFKNFPKIEENSVIINATGFTSLMDCEDNYENCYTINTKIVENFFKKFSEDLRFVQVSTDQLYDGIYNQPNKENGKIKIKNKYAQSKFEAEEICLKNSNSLIIRTNFTGIKNNKGETFYEWATDSIRKNRDISLFSDMYNSTIDVKSASEFIIDLVKKGARGVFNLGSSDIISKKDFILKIASELKLKFTNYKISSVESVVPTRCKYLGLNVSKISNFLNVKMPSSSSVVKRLVRGDSN